MAYTPTNWTNFPSTATPVNASNLNKIESELVALDTGKADTTALDDKVDKVAGKGLSENDFTDTLKDKLDGISEQANKVEITPVVTEGTTLATISIDGVDTDIKGSDIDVDDTPSPTSPNPLENKAVYELVQSILPEATAEGNPISITDASGLSAKSCEVTFSPIQSGSGEPSPENVRPISGWTELVLNQCGKNLSSVNLVSDVAWAVANADLKTIFNSLKNGTYTISFDITVKTVTSTGDWIYGFMAHNPNGNVSKMTTVTTDATVGYNGSITYTFTITDSNRGAFTSVNLYGCGTWTVGGKGTADFSNIQIEIGNQKTDYSAYQGSTHTATFPDTVYGGKLDFVSGKLVVNKVLINLGSLTWTRIKDYLFRAPIDNIIDAQNLHTGIMCSQYSNTEGNGAELYNDTEDMVYAVNSVYLGIGSGGIAIHDSRYAQKTDFIAAINGVKFSYPLATPQEITLTPETIALLKGNNTLWTDGDNITLKYSADIKQWVLAQLQS